MIPTGFSVGERAQTGFSPLLSCGLSEPGSGLPDGFDARPAEGHPTLGGFFMLR